MIRRCGVIGSPIAHSLSPALHRAAYESLGLDWSYERYEVRADEVPGFVAGLDPAWRGLSVTMPCKTAVVSLGRPDPVVAALGVANTVVFDGDPGDPGTTTLHNTDVSGMRMILTDAGLTTDFSVLLYGNGATARSCVYALSLMGVSRVQVRARNDTTTCRLASDAAGWGIEVIPFDSALPPADVLISTVPADVAGAWGTAGCSLVADVLYNPWPTPLAVQAECEGVPLLTGLDLLAAQAVGQVELMTGCAVEFSLLRAAADQALHDRHR